MSQFLNTALASGTYQLMDVNDSSQVVVELSAISVEKASSRRIWNDDPMDFTITVRNVDTGVAPDPGDPITNVVITDTIALELATLIEDSITVSINGTEQDPPDYTYNDETGLLTVNIGTLEPGWNAVISFRCEKVVEEP